MLKRINKHLFGPLSQNEELGRLAISGQGNSFSIDAPLSASDFIEKILTEYFENVWREDVLADTFGLSMRGDENIFRERASIGFAEPMSHSFPWEEYRENLRPLLEAISRGKAFILADYDVDGIVSAFLLKTASRFLV